MSEQELPQKMVEEEPSQVGRSWALVGAILGLLAFWALRYRYWMQTHELPFSDMADFERIALGILHNFSFNYDDFWRSYKMPVLPLLGAGVFGIFGEHNYLAWQLFQASLLSVFLAWLGSELSKATRSPWLGTLLIWTVALSKPSVFWSLKYATESVAEALVYGICASFLYAQRRNLLWSYCFTGILITAASLNRPNYLPILPCLVVVMLLPQSWSLAQYQCKRRLVCLFMLCCGLVVSWAPWTIRAYRLYGVPLLTNTSGGHSLIFDLGEVRLTLPDGTKEVKTNNDLLGEAPHRFANDYLSHLHAKKFFWEWFQEDPWRYFRLVKERALIGLKEHNVYLTTVSRTELTGGKMNVLLIDKSPLVLVLGLVGLLALALVGGTRMLVVPAMAVVPWFAAILVANTSRYLDPMVPLLLFGNVVLGFLALRALCRVIGQPCRIQGLGQHEMHLGKGC